MGSFDVSCGLSSLPIHTYDNTGFVILEKKPVYLPRDFPSPGKTLIVNATDLYRPVLPPVFGVYDDYGRITDIRETATTKVIEKMFGRPVQQVIDCIVSSDDIYDMRSTVAETYASNPNLITDRPESIPDHLKNLGFTVENQGRVNAYVFNDYEIAEVPGDRYWFIRDRKQNKVLTRVPTHQDAAHLLNTFGYVTGTYPGFDAKDYKAIKSLNSYSGMFFMEEVFRGMDTFNKTEHYMNNYDRKRTETFKEEWREAMDELLQAGDDGADAYFGITNNMGMELFFRELAFPAKHFPLLTLYKDAEEEILELRSIIKIAEDVNRPLAPSAYSNLGDGDRPAKMMNTIVTHILGKREQEWDDENLPPEDPEEGTPWTFPSYP